jgi:hypothetical protein
MSESGDILRDIRDEKKENELLANEYYTAGIREKCAKLSEYFLPIFEDFWSGEDKVVTEDVKFALDDSGLTFQIAFAVEYDLVSVEGLSPQAIEDIIEAYWHLVNLSG